MIEERLYVLKQIRKELIDKHNELVKNGSTSVEVEESIAILKETIELILDIRIRKYERLLKDENNRTKNI
jgi:hypothetical protein